MNAKRLLSGFIRKLWLTVAFLLVTLALVLSAVRVGLPYANDFKEQIASWFEKQFNQPIQIDRLTANWHSSGPSIEMLGFQFITETENNPPIIVNIKQVDLELDFWHSIVQRTPVVKNFVLDGVEVLIDLNKLKAAEKSDSNIALVDLFRDIFLDQFQRFDIQNSYITMITPDDAAHQIQVHQLKWFNQGDEHQGVGEFSLEGIEEDKLAFILDLTNSGEKDYSGQFYVKSDGIDLAPWAAPYLAKRVRNLQSRLKFEAWLDIKQSHLDNLLLNFDPSPMSWYLGSELKQFELVSGQVQAKLTQENPELYFYDMSFAQGEQLWGGLNFHLQKSEKNWHVFSPRINLLPAKAMASLFNLPKQANQFIHAMNGEPSIENLSLSYQDSTAWRVNGSIIDFSWDEFAGLPQVKSLSAQFSASPGKVVTQWYLPESELNWQSVFDKKLQIKSANAVSILSYTEDDWSLIFPQINLNLAQLQLKSHMAIRPDEQEQITLSVFSELGKTKVKSVPDFLPRKLIGEDTYTYLERALVKGDISSGQLIWQGKLADYPFKDNQGIFKAQLQLNQADFSFQPDWPTASNIDLELTFFNQGLFFQSKKANLLDAKLIDLDAKINDLTADDIALELDANLQAEGDAVAQIMQQSSLKDSVGLALEQVKVTGGVNLNLSLHIPLKQSKNLVAKGEILFNKNTVTIEPTGFVFQHVNGLLEFNMDKLTGKKMSFDWGPVPYQMDITSQDAAEGYNIAIDLRGNWPIDSILTQSGFLNMADRVKGTAHVDGHLGLQFPKGKGFSYQLDVASDMYGVSLDLPAPYQKSADKLRITNLTIQGNQDSSLFELSSANNLSFSAVLPHEQSAFSRVYLILGESVLSSPAQGFNISTYLDSVDFNQYVSFINQLSADISGLKKGEGPAIIDMPQRIRGEVKNLNLGPLVWHNVNFDTQRQEGAWLTHVQADEFRGNVTAFDNWDKQGLNIAAEQLFLKFAEVDKQTGNQSNSLAENVQISRLSSEEMRDLFSAIPPIKFSCASCYFEDKNLGKVNFDIVRASPNDLLLKGFNLKYREHSVEASGLWRLDEASRSSTQLRGSVNSSDFGHWLRDYQLTSAIRDSSIKADFLLKWPQAPMDASYQYLNGDIDWRLGEGYLTEVSDKGARILSVLSLDSLVRKLKLDFRDVFSKGLFYNQMKGKVKLTNGLAYTDNTHMDGVAGNMDVTGSTDLVSQKLNYNVRFSPKVTSSLPILIAWMVNPVTGIAALAIDQVIESADVISQIKFNIGGTIDNPKIVETARESREVKLKPAEKKSLIQQKKAQSNTNKKSTNTQNTNTLNNPASN